MPLSLSCTLRVLALTLFASANAKHPCYFYSQMGGSRWLSPAQPEPLPGWSCSDPAGSVASPDVYCKWYGISCDDAKAITGLALPFVGVSGPMSEDLFIQSGMLGLEALDLQGNELDGELLTSVCTLKELTKLDLSWNGLSGPLPQKDCWSGLPRLNYLDVSMNFFSGELDHDIFAENSLLATVFLGHNGREINFGSGVSYPGFQGKFPYVWPDSLQYLDASQNSFMLSLEEDLCTNTNLVYLKLQKNLINGDLPTCFSSLR